jgi:hypothetical protein
MYWVNKGSCWEYADKLNNRRMKIYILFIVFLFFIYQKLLLT